MELFRRLGFLTVFAAAACGGDHAVHDDVAVSLRREVVVDGLKSPWSIAFLSSDEALITEKEGGLLRVDLRNGDARPIEGLPDDLTDDIRASAIADNGGLFDVVLHPDFADNSLVYLSYAARK